VIVGKAMPMRLEENVSEISRKAALMTAALECGVEQFPHVTARAQEIDRRALTTEFAFTITDHLQLFHCESNLNIRNRRLINP
jgi:hypothetical protein